jgi:hypothetical protein
MTEVELVTIEKDVLLKLLGLTALAEYPAEFQEALSEVREAVKKAAIKV